MQHYPRVYMRQLRRNKIEEDSAQPRYLLTEVGIGFVYLVEIIMANFLKAVCLRQDF